MRVLIKDNNNQELHEDEWNILPAIGEIIVIYSVRKHISAKYKVNSIQWFVDIMRSTEIQVIVAEQ